MALSEALLARSKTTCRPIQGVKEKMKLTCETEEKLT